MPWVFINIFGEKGSFRLSSPPAVLLKLGRRQISLRRSFGKFRLVEKILAPLILFIDFFKGHLIAPLAFRHMSSINFLLPKIKPIAE